MKKIKISSVIELEISEELYKRIQNENKLKEFCINNCFRNNTRKLKKVDVIE